MVLLLPPSESWRIRVSFESLYGMYSDLFVIRLAITLPNEDRDKFIFLASSRPSPDTPVRETLNLILS